MEEEVNRFRGVPILDTIDKEVIGDLRIEVNGAIDAHHKVFDSIEEGRVMRNRLRQEDFRFGEG